MKSARDNARHYPTNEESIQEAGIWTGTRFQGNDQTSDGDCTTDKLHASFDASILKSDEEQPLNGGGLFSEGTTAAPRLAAASWDDLKIASREVGSGGKSFALTTSTTPARPRPARLRKTGSKPPISAGKKRHVSVSQHHVYNSRKSPQHSIHRRQQNNNATADPSMTKQSSTDNEEAVLVQRNGTTLFASLHSLEGLDDDEDDADAVLDLPSEKKKAKPCEESATTRKMILRANSADQADATPYCFSSFPASLPRVNHIVRGGVATASAQAAPVMCQTSVRKRMSFGDEHNKSSSTENSSLNNTSLSSLQDDQEAEEFDDDSSSHLGTPVMRTRLTFESALFSPRSRLGSASGVRLMPDDAAEHAATSFTVEEDDFVAPAPNRVSIETAAGGSCGGSHDEENLGLNSVSQTPSRDRSLADHSFLHDAPSTPQDMQFQFQLDAAQCSPIPGIPEEDDENVSSKGGSAFSRGRRRCNTSRDSDKSRGSARPMPDMAAFDADPSSNTSGGWSDGGSLSSSAQGDGIRGAPPSPPHPKLLCPPTPIRTPAIYATAKKPKQPRHSFGRSNSLIQTKVLATCPAAVLDGRASLENSSELDEEEESDVLGSSKENEQTNTTTDTSRDSTMTRTSGCAEAATESSSGLFQAPSNEWLDELQESPNHVRTQASSVLDDSSTAATAVVSLATHFEVLSTLGRGAFADVYRVRSKLDGRSYAVKRNRRQFRGKRDREHAMAEVKCMQTLQNVCVDQQQQHRHHHLNYSLYLLFFYQAWQEEGHFFCQTELCCRDTCRELMDAVRLDWTRCQSRYPSLRRLAPYTDAPNEELSSSPSFFSHVDGRLFPEASIWKICHDIAAGLSHIHSGGFCHFDIKPANIFLAPHSRLGAMCKIGDFGMAGPIGSSEDGQEGDQKYMAPEVLVSDKKHPSADIFSLGLTLYEVSSSLSFVLPSEGARWHELRSGRQYKLDIPNSRSQDLSALIQSALEPNKDRRTTAESILSLTKVAAAGNICDTFLRDYIRDIEAFDRVEEQLNAAQAQETPRQLHKGASAAAARAACSPSARSLIPAAPTFIYSPETAS